MLREYAVPFLLQLHHSFPSSFNALPRRTPNYRLYNRSNKIHIMMADADADAEKLLNHAGKDDVDNHGISHAMMRGLLLDPDMINNDPNHQASCNETCDENYTSNHQDYNPSTTELCHNLRGLPKRPLYEEISRRLRIIQQYNNVGCNKDDDEYEALPCFLPASHFGLTEICTLNELIPPPPSTPIHIDECTRWIQNAGQDGIYAILGCRRTIGTVQLSSTTPPSYLLPPTIPQLLDASRKRYKPNTKSSLTVAARALAKHAHRGAEQFFGILKGSEAQKNEYADRVIHRLIDEAMWMNVHCFGGIDESNPVLEIRTYEGYGARWSAIWNSDVFSPVEVEFRGFLEPQMEGGHEKRWRH